MQIELDRNRPTGVTTLMSVGDLEGVLDDTLPSALLSGAAAFIVAKLLKIDGAGLIGLGVSGLVLAAKQW